ncbi:CHAT domain-containing tetratricopeptide repeat protein [Tolypothrix tenuis]
MQQITQVQRISETRNEGAQLNRRGLQQLNTGQFRQALQSFEKALVIFKNIRDEQGKGAILNNIGEVYRNLGQYSKALEFYQQSLGIRQKISDIEGKAATLNNIGLLYNGLGQYDEALKYYQQALAVVKQISNTVGKGRVFNNIGLAYDNLKEYDKALEYYQKALDIAREIDDKAGQGQTLNNIGAVYSSLQQYAKALESFQQAVVILKTINDIADVGQTLNNIGFVYKKQGQYAKALDYYQQALAIRQRIGDTVGEGLTLNNIGAAYNSLGSYADAEKTLLAAIEVWESLRTRQLTDDQKISIFETQAFTYRFLQEALIGQNKITTALEISERGRARAFIDLLASRTKTSIADTAPQSSTPSIAQLKKIAQQQKATFVEYSVIDNSELYIWVVKPTGEIAFKKVDLKSLKTPLKKLVETSRRSLGVMGAVAKERGPRIENPPLPSPETQKRRLQQLHELLITPIANHLPKNPSDRVIFIPNESLFLVPFPALKDANNKYLIEKHTILTAPAIQVLNYTRKNTETLNIASLQPGDTLLVGNPIMPITGIPPVQQPPLPGTEKEANKIAPILNTQPLIGKQATKSAVLQKISTAKIIHLATHGLLYGFGERIPGAIALTPDTPGVNEGLLKTTEIINLNLNADLVVLSACDTGGGEITGDGVVGLSRSLLTAGAESVIVSLWAVDDSSTSDLMVEFYRQLQQNPDKAKALRQAMLSTMKKYPHPIHWAAFTLIGNAE